MAELSTLSRSVAGKTALITGCASGMGRATAKLFAAEGANVAATDINGEGVRETVAEIRAAGREATSATPRRSGGSSTRWRRATAGWTSW